MDGPSGIVAYVYVADPGCESGRVGRASLLLACGEPGWRVGGVSQGPGRTRFVFRVFRLGLGGAAAVGVEYRDLLPPE